MKTNSKGRKNSAIRRRGVLNYFVVFSGVLLLVIFKTAPSSAALTTIFSENMGTPSGTTTIAANTFQNSGTLTYSGNVSDVRTTTSSLGAYTGASGGGNVFLTSGGTVNFMIGSINTVGYSGLSLSFGAFKSTTTSTISDYLRLAYSIDGGSTFTDLSFDPQPTGTGTASWRLISGISLPSNAVGVSDLRLVWVNRVNAGGVQFRLDDIKLEGIETALAVVPEPATYLAGLLLALPFGVHGVRYLRNRKRA